MDNKILTPLQIWQDYDPESAPLQISFTDFRKQNGRISFEAFFNGDNFGDGAPRIFVNGSFPTSVSPKIAVKKRLFLKIRRIIWKILFSLFLM